MKYVDEFRDSSLARPLVDELRRAITRPIHIMEVCGTHTMSIFRNGIRSILPEGCELLSGPGCPVCVTSASHMDAFISMALEDKVRLAIFGDLYRVPGSKQSLADAGAQGARIDIVYSPMDALILAENNPDDTVIFLGVGFETTTPGVAATIQAAKIRNIKNFTVYSTHKIMPPPLHALLQDPELAIDGLLCPGHVSSIIGASAYQPLVDQYGLACVVAGFEPTDLLASLTLLARQVGEGSCKVENNYTRAVTWEGNLRAKQMVETVFEETDTEWRGLGVIAGSGLAIREEFVQFDAEKRFDIPLVPTKEPRGCSCGAILKGKQTPKECALFSTICTPAHPVGPCMVSSEGTCAAFYKYGNC